VVAALLPLTGYVGIGFMVVALATSLWWLAMALRGYRPGIDVNGWARQVFFFSIITVTALSVTMALDFNEVSPNLLVFAAH
ncbi:MAG: protoheme IX farnesyltransferase, partial [Gammaproteobacteria bacterium]|nr:protoheme IX farnesyltransferase [Gammaproteobacteria bacterium]